jgi:hypothetical protein
MAAVDPLNQPDDRFPDGGSFEHYWYYRQWWWFFGWHYTDFYYGRTQCDLVATYVGTDGQNNDYYAVHVNYTITPSIGLFEPYYDTGTILNGWITLTLGSDNYLQEYEPRSSIRFDTTFTTSSSGDEAGYVKWFYSVGYTNRNTKHVFELTILVYTTNHASLIIDSCQSYTYWELLFPNARQGFSWTPFSYYTFQH